MLFCPDFWLVFYKAEVGSGSLKRTGSATLKIKTGKKKKVLTFYMPDIPLNPFYGYHRTYLVYSPESYAAELENFI